ncbi:MAG: signal peptidase II [Bdellovibrionales bacterium]|jgi:signal peptidase II|nr:signal peptidase II [Bdellovibrionales bacterium]
MQLRRIDWTLVLLPLFLTWGIDQGTKAWAEGIRGLQFYGPFGLVLHHNHGAMLGLFSDLPAVLRIVTLSTGGAFLIFSFAFIQYLLPIKSLLLRSGMSVLLGGILGNVTDRIVNGYVIDFLLIGSPERASPAFNMADALQWVGYAMIAIALIRESEILWPADNTRKRMWVNLKFQLRYCFILTGVGLGFALNAGVFSYTFLRVTIIDLVGTNQKLLDHYLLPFVLTFIIVSLSFAAVLFLVGRVLSSRIAGPLYAFEKFLDDLAAGRPRPLRLRAGDEFRHLEHIAARLSQQLIENKLLEAPNAAPAADATSSSETRDENAAASEEKPAEKLDNDEFDKELPANVMPLKRSPERP